MRDTLPLCPSRDDFVKWLYQQHYDQLYLHALRLCAKFHYSETMADDLLQELFEKVLKDFAKIYKEYQKKGIAYLKRMMINRLTDLWRQNQSQLKNEKEYLERHFIDIPVNLYDLCPEIPMEQLLEDIKQYLSETDHLMMSYHLIGYKYHEIGQKMNLNPMTVSTKVFRAKKRLRTVLQDDLYGQFFGMQNSNKTAL